MTDKRFDAALILLKLKVITGNPLNKVTEVMGMFINFQLDYKNLLKIVIFYIYSIGHNYIINY